MTAYPKLADNEYPEHKGRVKVREREERNLSMRAMYESGASTTEVGGAYNLDSSQVSRVLRAIGTQMRERRRLPVEFPTYRGAHMRVKAIHGPASNHRCECGAPAAQWAYLHNDPNELIAPEGPYSTDPECYIPMCISCHKRMDLSVKPAQLRTHCRNGHDLSLVGFVIDASKGRVCLACRSSRNALRRERRRLS